MAQRGLKRKEPDEDDFDATASSPHVLDEAQDEASCAGDEDESEPHQARCERLEGQWTSWKEFDAVIEKYLQDTAQPFVRRSSKNVQAFLNLPRKKGQPEFIIPPGEYVYDSI